jgi:hypothetical protein
MPALGIFKSSLGVDIDLAAVVIDMNDIAGKKAIADDAVYLFPIYAAEDIVIIYMKIEAVHPETGEVQGLIINEFYLSYAGDAQDGLIGREGGDTQTLTGSRIQGNAAAACVQDEIQTVRKIADACSYQDHAACKYGEGEAGDEPGLRRNEFLLCRCCQRAIGTEEQGKQKEQYVPEKPEGIVKHGRVFFLARHILGFNLLKLSPFYRLHKSIHPF